MDDNTRRYDTLDFTPTMRNLSHSVTKCSLFDCSGIMALFRSKVPDGVSHKSSPEEEGNTTNINYAHSLLHESMNSEGEAHHFSTSLSTAMRDVVEQSKELDAAVDACDHSRVKAALNHGANPNHFHSLRPETLLMSACFNGDSESVLLLLAANADPNQGVMDKKRSIQITPLMIAAENGMTETVSALLQARANPHARNSNGETALLAAARTNNHDAFAVLVGSMVSSTVS
jgi:ankyrin repeat protein